MDVYKSKLDLENYSWVDILRLAKFFNIKARERNDLLWLLALRIMSRRGEMISGTINVNDYLENQLPRQFGELDEDQRKLIEIGARPLILLENANDIIGHAKNKPGFLEKGLEYLSSLSRETTFIPPETFPIRSDLVNAGEKEYYNDLITSSKEAFLHKVDEGYKKIITIFAVDILGDEDENEKRESIGGHYASFYVDVNRKFTEVFDSMASDERGGGFYTEEFLNIADNVFGFRSRHPARISDIKSLQLTGGFVDKDTPTPQTLAQVMGNKYPKIDGLTTLDYILQSTESQNHFCYFWALWNLNHRVCDRNTMDSVNRIYDQHIDPLVVIKRYIWCLLLNPAINLISYIKKNLRPFLEAHFLYIWTDDLYREGSTSPIFRLYRIPDPGDSDCLQNSTNILPSELIPA